LDHSRRRAGQLVSHPGMSSLGVPHHDRRRTGRRRTARPGATDNARMRRRAMRDLHSGDAHSSPLSTGRQCHSDLRRYQGSHCRKSLPLHRICEDHRSNRRSGGIATIMTDVQRVQSASTLVDAYAVLAERGSTVRIIAGGTDLMVLMNAHALDAMDFLDIWGLDELRGITDRGNTLRVGALTTFAEIARSPLVLDRMPALAAASRTVGAIQIQNRATIGGNIVNASPAGDSLPVLAAYEAEIEAGSTQGVRRIPFRSFYAGYRQTTLEPNELVVAIWIPKLSKGDLDYF